MKIGIGPAIENGFYYDFDPGRPFTPEDLEKIEAEMKRIVAEDNAVVRKEMSKAEAVKLFEAQNDPLKVEIVAGIPEGSLSCYEQKDFIDLCRGPHVPSTGKLGVFKLTHAAGAYWKGDERNPMLQRIYGAVFLTQKELDEHLARLEAAKARDHRKLGKELGLFVFHPWAPASPFFLPKGATVYNLLDRLHARRCTSSTATRRSSRPRSSTRSSSRRRGTTENYHENMYFTDDDEREFGVKPMNCPGHCLMFGVAGVQLPRPARAVRRLRAAPPLREVRRHAGPDARPYLLAGRLAHLRGARPDRPRDGRLSSTFLDEVYGTFAFQDVAISLGAQAREARRGDAVLGPRREGARGGPEGDGSALRRLDPATGRSTARRSTST